nr:chemotaxis protein CheW [uncultured Methanoregula sp.]
MTTEPAERTAGAGGAQSPAKAVKKDGAIHVVVFALGSEQFAINLFDVREVVEYTTITKLPNVPSYIKGIIDLRGEITTIVDLRYRLNLPEAGLENQDNSRIIVLDSTVTRVKTGILVDDVTTVATFEESQVDYTSASMGSENSAILGIIKKKVKLQEREKNELIIWIDIKTLLEEEGR